MARLAQGKLTVSELIKLEADCKGHRMLALNDIVLRNAVATIAVRYRVSIDGLPFSGEIIGDGLVVATPYGSSAYYRSITNSVIQTGIGIAFNNSTESINHLVISENSTLEIEITRGPAILTGDNAPKPIEVNQGDLVTIHFAPEKAEIWDLGSLMCLDCINKRSGKPAGYLHVLKQLPSWDFNTAEAMRNRDK